MIYFSIPKKQPTIIQDITLGINPPKGNPDSNIIMIEFSDFQCPACKASQSIISEILDEYDIVLYYRNFPLSIHENSFIAAEAAQCANEQNSFWQYHDILFENQNNLDKENLKKYAQELNLNLEQFSYCLESEKYKGEIKKDINNGKSYGVRGTPSFFINGRKVSPVKEEIERIIKEELEEQNI